MINGNAILHGNLAPTTVPEDYSTEYTYNEVGAPLSVRRYGQNGVRKISGLEMPQDGLRTDNGLEVAEYGLMDDLSYVWEGMMLSSVTAQAAGTEFYGRTGYPLSAAGGVAQYAWNKAGMLYSDSSRGIKKMTYNHMGQPSTVQFTDGGELQYTYSASGELLGVSTYAVLAGKRRPVKVSERSYCGDFVFDGDSLAYVNFPGGYFDGNGGAHYRHPDFQGNITMVTDSEGKIEQHTGYYPYGEPWHEPAGQPYLYGGKERMRDGGLNDYDFSARRLNSALALWSTPDPKAIDFTPINPYVYCAGNPIRYVDPTGCIFTDSAQVVINYYRNNINNKIKKEQQKIDDKNKKGNTKIDKHTKKIEELNGILNELNELEKSSTTYNIVENRSHKKNTITWDNDKNAVLITLKDNKDLASIAHETLHAYQFETGLLDLSAIPNSKYNPLAYDITDEYAAFERGKIFGGGTIFDQWDPSYDLLDHNYLYINPDTSIKKLNYLKNKRKRVFKCNGILYKPD